MKIDSVKVNRAIILVLFAALIFFSVEYFNERNKRIEQENLVTASNDELETWVNKNGENVAKIAVLETEKSKTFLAFESKDIIIRELQQLVRDNKKLFNNSKGVAGIIKSETNINAIGVTTVIQDTVNNSPIYKSNITNEWYNINTFAAKDTTTVKLKTYHSLSLVMGSESQGLFKKKKIFATAKDANPNSNITDMRIYNVTEAKRSPFSIGPYVGFGATLTGTDIKVGWQAGAGVKVDLIELLF
jgi:hypothetical protein